jgi:hypothetical protein
MLNHCSKFSIWKISLVVIAVGCLFASTEVLLVLLLRVCLKSKQHITLLIDKQPLYSHGLKWPITVLGAVAAILLAVGLLPPYAEIYKHKGRVHGLSKFNTVPSDAAQLIGS